MFDESTGTAQLPGSHELRSSAAYCRLDGLGAVVVRGDDRKGWLQGQVTQDLRDLALDGSCLACLLKATGQIEAMLRIGSLPDRFIVLTEAPEFLLDRAKRFVILEDVRAEAAESVVVTVQGPQASEALGTLVSLPIGDTGNGEIDGELVTLLRSRRTFAGGWDVIVPSYDGPSFQTLAKAFPAASSEAFDLAMLEAGHPVFGVDVDSKTLPPELGHHFVATHVSYDKGCYTGQEIVARIQSRGHTNRTWVGLVSSNRLAPGAEVRDRGGSPVGKVARSGLSPVFGWIGSAMIRNQASDPGTLVWVEGVEAEVCDLPFEGHR